MGLNRSGRMSPRSRMGAKWLGKIKKTQVAHKDSIALSVVHLSPLGSQLSFSHAPRIDTVVDWDPIRRKYRELFCVKSVKSTDDNKDSNDIESVQAITESTTVPANELT